MPGGVLGFLRLLTQWETGQPATPATGVSVFARRRGRNMLAWVDNAGHDTAVQSSTAFNRVVTAIPLLGTAGGMSVSGASLTAYGSATNTPTIASGSFNNGVPRVVYSSTAGTANSRAGAGMSANAAQLTTRAATGGFHAVIRFSVPVSPPTAARFLAGLVPIANVPAAGATTEPSALLNFIGVGADTSDTNLQLMTNDGTGAATKVNLGSSFLARPTTDAVIYELSLSAPPGNGTTLGPVQWAVRRLIDGVNAPGTITTDLPVSDTLFAPVVWGSQGNQTSAAFPLGIVQMYLETDN